MSVDTAVVSCRNCGLQLDEDSNTSPETRLPCLSCGSMSRAIHVTVRNTITIKEPVSGLENPVFSRQAGALKAESAMTKNLEENRRD